VAVAQSDGKNGYFYLISGQNLEETSEGITKLTFLKDAYKYNTRTNEWSRLADLPVSVCGATGLSLDEKFVAIFGGSSGFKENSVSIEKHPGFSKRILFYNSLTDSWKKGGNMPEGVVTTTVARWGKDIIIPSGEIRPGVRTPMIYVGKME
jgi:N-acetylneuraminic acid mutarotase